MSLELLHKFDSLRGLARNRLIYKHRYAALDIRLCVLVMIFAVAGSDDNAVNLTDERVVAVCGGNAVLFVDFLHSICFFAEYSDKLYVIDDLFFNNQS